MKDWKTYRLGDFLERQYDSISVDSLIKYKRITIKTKGQGIELRDEVEGIDIGTKNQFRAKHNQFLLSKIDAMNGAFGIVPAECDGGIITGNFWTYDLNEEIIDREYLRLLCIKQEFTKFSLAASEGTTNRKYLRENKFLNLSISLPPITEQHRIISKIESVKKRVEEVKKLREGQEKELANFHYSYFKNLIDEFGLSLLAEGIELCNDFIKIDDEVTYSLCRVQTKTLGIVLREKKTGFEIKTKKQQVCKAGEFLVAEMDARFGGYGIVPDELDGAIVSSHYFLYSFKEEKLNKKYLEYFSRTNWFFEQVVAKGSTNYAAIRPKQVLNYQIPLPPIEAQNKIVSILDKLNFVKTNHIEINEELGQLIPALLDKAFKGEL